MNEITGIGVNPQSSTLTIKYPNDLLLFVCCSFQPSLMYTLLYLLSILHRLAVVVGIRSIPHTFMYLNNTWSSIGAAIGYNMKPLAGEYFLVDVYH